RSRPRRTSGRPFEPEVGPVYTGPTPYVGLVHTRPTGDRGGRDDGSSELDHCDRGRCGRGPTLAANAQQPTVELVPVNDVEFLTGADSPCPFDVTFTGTGTVERTTFYDNQGNPIRQSIHGALTHTISSAWHTLVSNGPAPVHIDLTTGQMVDTGL